jgi:spoIIIJ-associated protein
MVYEFEGKTEKEAIDAAVAELGLKRDEFDVEIMETQKSGFLNLSKKVHIRVHLHQKTARAPAQFSMNPDPANDFEHGVCDFLRQLTDKMGYPAKVRVMFREEDRLGLRLDSENSGVLIGKKGKNLDSIQLLANVIAAKLADTEFKVIVDAENYRSRREEALIRLAQRVGDQVMQTRKSRLLEPMNPFERRLIHTTLADIAGIETKSEGEGLYKQVRISIRGQY